MSSPAPSTATPPSDSTAPRTGSQVVLDALVTAGVEVVFGYPGGAIMPLYDALYDSPLAHVLVRHEQGAIHAADGFARASGKLGVCLATSGPGATNLVTGIYTAMMDSVPIVCLTGQVGTGLIGTDAFQEADVLGMVAGITKHAQVVRHVDDLPAAMAEAIYLATTGRPGPVLLDLPKDVQRATTTRRAPERVRVPAYRPQPRLKPEQVRCAHQLLRESKRPVCIIGGGCKLAGATEAFRTWCRQTQVPVVSTSNGLGSAEPGYAGYLGMLGMHGLPRANRTVDQADLVIALGMRFDDRVTGDPDRFATGAQIVHVDIDEAELGKIIPVHAPIHANLRTALDAWNDLLVEEPIEPFTSWQQESLQSGSGLVDAPLAVGEVLSPTAVLDELLANAGGNAIVTTDVGQHQMWVAQRIMPADPRNFITSGGAGTMGFGLPSAIGAQLACPNRRVMAVAGDGGFQMTLAELATLRRLNVPVKIVVIDNQRLGMVRQWQDLFFDRRQSYVDLSDNPDFARLAEVYGIQAYRLDHPRDQSEVLAAWWNHPGPALLHCVCCQHENVYPIVPAGAALGEMMEKHP